MKIIKFAIIIMISVAFFACEDIIEVDLTDYDVLLLAPSNGLSTAEQEQSFYWEELKGADEYNLQIVRPRFSSISQFVLDTTITGNSFNFTLVPNEYEWRVKAINTSSHTDYSVFQLTVE